MILTAKLQLRQTQSLVMTPQLLQSIKLLQMSHVELQHFLDLEAEKNPLLDYQGIVAQLESGASSHSDPFPDADQSSLDPALADSERGQENAFVSPENAAEDLAQGLDMPLDNLFPDDQSPADSFQPALATACQSVSQTTGRGSSDFPDDGSNLDLYAGPPLSLRDHIDEQIIYSLRNARDAAIAADLADHLDEAGYLHAELETIAHAHHVDRACVERVLGVCQSFEPAGIFARNLAECLTLQMAACGELTRPIQILLQNLDLLAKRDFAALSRFCHVEEGALLQMAARIRALDPKPGSRFLSERGSLAAPDIIIREAPSGGWAIELNEEVLPRVLVNQTYYQEVAPKLRSDQERSFLNECLRNANWLTRSLDQRARTMLKIAGEIIRQQDEFLIRGVQYLRPLNLKDVAAAVNMHESTVSRVTANKYMLTPRGFFELRYFFNGAIASASGGDSHASEAVRHRIRQMIVEEKTSSVLSDDQIVGLLKKNGVDIARRTVAKYREGMNIPSSVHRRREKRAIARTGQ